MKSFVWRAAAGAALLLTIAGSAAAQQPTQAQASAIKQACRADYQRHCASVPPGGSAAAQCLQQNAAALSAPCQQALGAVSGGSGASARAPQAAPAPMPAAGPMSMRQELAIMRNACGPDYHRYCNDVRPGGGRAISCLRAHGPQLSRTCRSALISARQAP